MKPGIQFTLDKSHSNILFNDMEIKAKHRNGKIVLDLIYSGLYLYCIKLKLNMDMYIDMDVDVNVD